MKNPTQTQYIISKTAVTIAAIVAAVVTEETKDASKISTNKPMAKINPMQYRTIDKEFNFIFFIFLPFIYSIY